MAATPLCRDCGLPTHRDVKAVLCWDCMNARRLERERANWKKRKTQPFTRRSRIGIVGSNVVQPMYPHLWNPMDVAHYHPPVDAYPNIWAAKADMPRRMAEECQEVPR